MIIVEMGNIDVSTQNTQHYFHILLILIVAASFNTAVGEMCFSFVNHYILFVSAF